jgi:hypothetical protein
VKPISIVGVGILFALASLPARGQDFTAGKTPAQLFSSDCAECHRTPNGLAKKLDAKTLSGFLREHYTTKPETAGALAGYVAGFAGNGPPDVRNRAGAGPTAPGVAAGERGDRRNRRDAEATGGEDARSASRPPEEPQGRRRRTVNLSGDGEKRRVVRADGDAPRPPGNVAAPPPPPRIAPGPAEGAREATDPAARLRTYVFSGLGSESAIAEAAKTPSQKSRRRQAREQAREQARDQGREAAQAPAEAPAPAKTSVDKTSVDKTPVDKTSIDKTGGDKTVVDAPAPAVLPGATAAATPVEGNGAPAMPMPATAPASPPTPSAVVTPPRLGQ